MDVKTYFDKMADTWDEDILPIDEVRRCIVFLSGVKEHTRVLMWLVVQAPVCCFTGKKSGTYNCN